jgi:S1-C subfamily serine protease
MVWMNRDHFVKCTVVISLAQVDIAVLKLEKPINKPPLPLGDSARVQQGNKVYNLRLPGL